jgi:hypothetical protein
MTRNWNQIEIGENYVSDEESGRVSDFSFGIIEDIFAFSVAKSRLK